MPASSIGVRAIPLLDDPLAPYAPAIGADFAGYRNHAYRVANICMALAAANAEAEEKIAIAAAFHDIGIWTAGTFDYLAPSAAEAEKYVVSCERAASEPEVHMMILQHHKLLPYREHPEWLVEPFRKADLVDVSQGLIASGLPRSYIADLFSRWPSAGFHRRLAQLSLARLRSHPWSPLPMLKL